MAEAEQPRIDDLKRLLKRLEHATPASSDAPRPPPLPKSATPPASKVAEADKPKAPRPMLAWLAAGAATAAVAVAVLAGLQPRLHSPSREPTAKDQQAKGSPVTLQAAVPGQDGAGAQVQGAAPAPPTETAATAATPAPAKPEPQPQAAAPPPAPPAAVPAEAPKPGNSPPAPAETMPPSPVTKSGPIPESPALRAATAGPGRDKYESEARLDAYLERGQKLLDDGDLTAARSFFRRVAESGDPRGALAMGATYDSNYAGNLGIGTARPDNTVAGEWYRRAMELGSKDALDRLERLEK